MSKLSSSENVSKKTILPYVPLIVIIIVAVILGGYYLKINKGKNPFQPVLNQPTPTQSPFAKSEFIKGIVTGIVKDEVIVKETSGKIFTIKLLPQTMVIKQKRINSYTTGTEKSQLKIKDVVSIAAIKDDNGAWITNSIVIIDPTLDKTSSPSATPTKKP